MPHRRLIVPVAVIACLLPLASLAAGSAFVKGYVRGVLDVDYPRLHASVESATPDGHIRLKATHCLSGQTRARVARTLLSRRRIVAVHWDMPCPATALRRHAVEPLPPGPLFRPLLADPRQPRFSASYQYHVTDSKSFNAAAVAFGGNFGFLRGSWHGGTYQLGIDGGVFALFNFDTPSNDLENADYMVGLPLEYRRGPWSYRARVYHISSHLGDEFLLRHPNVQRINLSYEVFDALVSRAIGHLRLYGGGGHMIESTPALDPWMIHYGAEYRWPNFIDHLELDLAADFKQNQDQGWITNQSYELGMSFHRGQHAVRVMLEYYAGLSPNGQFFTDHLHYYGLGLQLTL